MFRTNRMRTLLTILGISVGIGTILFLVSFGYGIQRLILNQITTSESLLSLDVTPGEGAIVLDGKAIEAIKAIPGVERTSPLVTLQAQVKIGEISSELMANLANVDFFLLEGTRLKSGELFTDDGSGARQAVLSTAALALFDLPEAEALGRRFRLSVYFPADETGENFIRDFQEYDSEFVITGIIEDENSSFIYISERNVSILPKVTYSRAKIKVASEGQLDAVRNAIIDLGFQVSALSDIIDQANQIFKVVKIVLGLFGIVALMVSAIGMFNTMTIALLERTQEIGIMKALGATNSDIWNMFLGESVVIGIAGGVGGIAIGMLTGEAFNYGVNILAGALGGAKLDLFFTPYWFIVLVVSFSSVVGLLTGVYPASRAAKINCLAALRYK